MECTVYKKGEEHRSNKGIIFVKQREENTMVLSNC